MSESKMEVLVISVILKKEHLASGVIAKNIEKICEKSIIRPFRILKDVFEIEFEHDLIAYDVDELSRRHEVMSFWVYDSMDTTDESIHHFLNVFQAKFPNASISAGCFIHGSETIQAISSYHTEGASVESKTFSLIENNTTILDASDFIREFCFSEKFYGKLLKECFGWTAIYEELYLDESFTDIAYGGMLNFDGSDKPLRHVVNKRVKRVPMDFDYPLDKEWDGYINPYDIPCPDCESGKTYEFNALRRFMSSREWDVKSDDAPEEEALADFYHDLKKKLIPHRNRWASVSLILTVAAEMGLVDGWHICETCGGFSIESSVVEAYQNWELTEPPTGEGYQLWEEASDAPISPVFESLDLLCEWCVEHVTAFTHKKTTKHEWYVILIRAAETEEYLKILN